jgi:hypothetical protein
VVRGGGLGAAFFAPFAGDFAFVFCFAATIAPRLGLFNVDLRRYNAQRTQLHAL